MPESDAHPQAVIARSISRSRIYPPSQDATKHSIPADRRGDGLLRRCAPRNDGKIPLYLALALLAMTIQVYGAGLSMVTPVGERLDDAYSIAAALAARHVAEQTSGVPPFPRRLLSCTSKPRQRGTDMRE